MTKKLKRGIIEVPIFSLGGKFVIYSYQHVPRRNRYTKLIKRTIKRGGRVRVTVIE